MFKEWESLNIITEIKLGEKVGHFLTNHPWWGGWWERIVKLCKDSLKRVVGRASVSYEELTTILCDCESFLNNRPLTDVSGECNDVIPFSPAHFFNDILSCQVTDLDFLSSISFSKRNRYVQRLRQEKLELRL